MRLLVQKNKIPLSDIHQIYSEPRDQETRGSVACN